MRVAGPAVSAAAAAVALIAGCSTGIGAGRGGQPRSAPIHTAANAIIVSPSSVADPRGSTGSGLASNPQAMPDADGNPACPVFDTWGAAGGDAGIAVAYWAHGADYVTVLVRTTQGHDIARSVNVQHGQALQLFEFPDTSPKAVHEVLIITNDTRCYATADPALRER
ncbi:MAG: hypothetical protein JO330_04420 [Mycobacteriaceae bacterium]|nr:hypothetical protein [Mycobacteriaceae bacterium]